MLATVCEEFDLERAVLIEQHHCEMNDIADILFAIDKFYQEQELEARVEFQSMDDEIKNKGRSLYNNNKKIIASVLAYFIYLI